MWRANYLRAKVRHDLGDDLIALAFKHVREAKNQNAAARRHEAIDEYYGTTATATMMLSVSILISGRLGA